MRICRRMPPGQQVIEDYRHLHLLAQGAPGVVLSRRSRRAHRPAAELLANSRSGASRHALSRALCWCVSAPAPGNAIFMTLEDGAQASPTPSLWPRTV